MPMSGLEAIGVIASASQLVDYSLKVIAVISEVYNRVKDAPERIARYNTQINQIIDAVGVIKENSDIQGPLVHKQLESTLAEVKRVYRLLERVRQDYTKGSGRRRVWKAITGDKEKRVLTCFESLEKSQANLLLCINIRHTQTLHNIESSVETLLKKAPNNYCEDMATPSQRVNNYQTNNNHNMIDTPPQSPTKEHDNTLDIIKQLQLSDPPNLNITPGSRQVMEVNSFQNSVSSGDSRQLNGNFKADSKSQIYYRQLSKDNSSQINGNVGKSAAHQHRDAMSTGSSLQVNGDLGDGCTLDDVLHVFGMSGK